MRRRKGIEEERRTDLSPAVWRKVAKDTVEEMKLPVRVGFGDVLAPVFSLLGQKEDGRIFSAIFLLVLLVWPNNTLIRLVFALTDSISQTGFRY